MAERSICMVWHGMAWRFEDMCSFLLRNNRLVWEDTGDLGLELGMWTEFSVW